MIVNHLRKLESGQKKSKEILDYKDSYLRYVLSFYFNYRKHNTVKL